MKMREGFKEVGFLSRQAKLERHFIENNSREWFELSCDLNALMMRIADFAISNAQGHNWTPPAVAIRLLLRTSETFQGIVLLLERGMVSPATALARTIVENSFCAAALLKQPDEVIKMLREDSEHSRKQQAKFIYENQLGDDSSMLPKLKEVIDSKETKPRLKWTEMAKKGGMLVQYLQYLHLSDSALHASASSLDRYIKREPGSDAWNYQMGAGLPREIDKAFHNALLAAIPVAIVATELTPDSKEYSALHALSERLLVLQQKFSD